MRRDLGKRLARLEALQGVGRGRIYRVVLRDNPSEAERETQTAAQFAKRGVESLDANDILIVRRVISPPARPTATYR